MNTHKSPMLGEDGAQGLLITYHVASMIPDSSYMWKEIRPYSFYLKCLCVSTSWACCGLLDIRRVAKPWRNSCKIDFKGILLLPFSPIEKKREKSESETNPGRRKIASIQTVINQILFSGFESPMSLRINTIQFYQEKYITFIRIGY
ncbi:uncharacterized protein LOC135364513 isoform X2 [Mirounga angustirostris]|uniref:uncharacterized protein LOC135364513 isoform X2 n=1 Tax=Mirounga angustirostris TaxID=9716 RepID=UPI00313B471B